MRCTHKRSPRPDSRGFTLVELMIVVALVAILAAVVIPSYRSHVIKTNRAAAEGFMSQVANKEEQIMLDMRGYVGVASTAAFGSAPPTGLSLTVPTSVSNNYNLSVTASAAGVVPPTYTITATPINPPQNDTLCQTLTLDNTGTKGVTGGATGGVDTCWQ